MSKLTAVLPRLEPGWEKVPEFASWTTRSKTTCSDNHRSSSMFLAVEDSTAMMRSRMNHVRSLTYEFHSFFGIEEPDIWLFIMLFIFSIHQNNNSTILNNTVTSSWFWECWSIFSWSLENYEILMNLGLCHWNLHNSCDPDTIRNRYGWATISWCAHLGQVSPLIVIGKAVACWGSWIASTTTNHSGAN